MRKTTATILCLICVAGTYTITRATEGALVAGRAVAAERPPGKLVWFEDGREAIHYPLTEVGTWVLECDGSRYGLSDVTLGTMTDLARECEKWEVMRR